MLHSGPLVDSGVPPCLKEKHSKSALLDAPIEHDAVPCRVPPVSGRRFHDFLLNRMQLVNW